MISRYSEESWNQYWICEVQIFVLSLSQIRSFLTQITHDIFNLQHKYLQKCMYMVHRYICMQMHFVSIKSIHHVWIPDCGMIICIRLDWPPDPGQGWRDDISHHAPSSQPGAEDNNGNLVLGGCRVWCLVLSSLVARKQHCLYWLGPVITAEEERSCWWWRNFPAPADTRL